MSRRIPCPICDGRGGELREVVIDPRKNGEVGNVRQEYIRCDACGGSGSIEVPDDDDDSGGGGRRR